MSLYDDARDALEPLHNVVHDVLPGPFARYKGGLVVGGTPVTVLLNTDDSEAYRDRIEPAARCWVGERPPRAQAQSSAHVIGTREALQSHLLPAGPGEGGSGNAEA